MRVTEQPDKESRLRRKNLTNGHKSILVSSTKVDECGCSGGYSDRCSYSHK